MEDITQRQAQIFEFIVDQIATNYTPPTLREMMAHFGITSPNGISCHLRALVAKGYLRHLKDGGGRCYVPIHNPDACLFCGAEVLPDQPPAS